MRQWVKEKCQKIELVNKNVCSHALKLKYRAQTDT